MEDPSLTLNSPAWNLTLGRQAPGHLALKTRWVHIIIVIQTRGLYVTETPLLRGTQKFHALRPNAEAVIWNEPGSDQLTDVEEHPRETLHNKVASPRSGTITDLPNT